MKKKNILMIVENFFPADTRVRKEADVLKQYFNVSVIALRKKAKSEKIHETVDGVQVFRIPEFPQFQMGKVRYILEYLYFTLSAALIFICTHPFKRYKVIHVHNPPDILFSVGLIGKLFFTKFIFDHHDLSPELYLTRFSGRKDIIYKGLVFAEKASCKLADVLISTNQSYKAIEVSRHAVDEDKIFVVRNNPLIQDCNFNGGMKKPVKRAAERKSILFLGAINPQDGVEILLKVVRSLVYDYKRSDFICTIVGDGDSLPNLLSAAQEMKINEYVHFTGMVYDRDKVKQYLFNADIGVDPAPRNELNNHSTFIKIMEYMATRIPIVAFDLRETRYSAGAGALLVPPNDIDAFVKAIITLLDDPGLREQLGRAGRERIDKDLQWSHASANLVKAYSRLFPETGAIYEKAD